jgi:hypothetical protein
MSVTRMQTSPYVKHTYTYVYTRRLENLKHIHDATVRLVPATKEPVDVFTQTPRIFQFTQYTQTVFPTFHSVCQTDTVAVADTQAQTEVYATEHACQTDVTRISVTEVQTDAVKSHEMLCQTDGLVKLSEQETQTVMQLSEQVSQTESLQVIQSGCQTDPVLNVNMRIQTEILKSISGAGQIEGLSSNQTHMTSGGCQTVALNHAHMECQTDAVVLVSASVTAGKVTARSAQADVCLLTSGSCQTESLTQSTVDEGELEGCLFASGSCPTDNSCIAHLSDLSSSALASSTSHAGSAVIRASYSSCDVNHTDDAAQYTFEAVHGVQRGGIETIAVSTLPQSIPMWQDTDTGHVESMAVGDGIHASGDAYDKQYKSSDGQASEKNTVSCTTCSTEDMEAQASMPSSPHMQAIKTHNNTPPRPRALGTDKDGSSDEVKSDQKLTATIREMAKHLDPNKRTKSAAPACHVTGVPIPKVPVVSQSMPKVADDGGGHPGHVPHVSRAASVPDSRFGQYSYDQQRVYGDPVIDRARMVYELSRERAPLDQGGYNNGQTMHVNAGSQGSVGLGDSRASVALSWRHESTHSASISTSTGSSNYTGHAMRQQVDRAAAETYLPHTPRQASHSDGNNNNDYAVTVTPEPQQPRERLPCAKSSAMLSTSSLLHKETSPSTPRLDRAGSAGRDTRLDSSTSTFLSSCTAVSEITTLTESDVCSERDAGYSAGRSGSSLTSPASTPRGVRQTDYNEIMQSLQNLASKVQRVRGVRNTGGSVGQNGASANIQNPVAINHSNQEHDNNSAGNSHSNNLAAGASGQVAHGNVTPYQIISACASRAQNNPKLGHKVTNQDTHGNPCADRRCQLPTIEASLNETYSSPVKTSECPDSPVGVCVCVFLFFRC